MSESKTPHLKVFLLAVSACLLWSTAFISIKLGMGQAQGIDRFSFAGIRFMISGFMLLPVLFFVKGGICQLKTRFKSIFIVGVIQTFMLYALFYSGLSYAPGALASIIIGSQPLMAAVITHFMMHNEKMTVGRVMALLVGFSGISVMVISRHTGTIQVGQGELLGIGFLVGSSVVAILANIVVVRRCNDLNPLVLTAGQLFVGGGLLLLLGVSFYPSPQFLSQPTPFYGTLLWLAFVSAGACSLWFWALKQHGVKVSELNTWKFLVPVSGATLCWCFLPAEKLLLSRDWGQLVGMCCVAISIISYNLIVIKYNKKMNC